MPLVHVEYSTPGTVKQYCLCDFTDAGGILDATTRCDIRSVTLTYDAFNGSNASGFRCAELLINTDNQGATCGGYDVVGRYTSLNADDDGGSAAQITIPLNKDITSFCLMYNFTPAGNAPAANCVASRIIGVTINKYA